MIAAGLWLAVVGLAGSSCAGRIGRPPDSGVKVAPPRIAAAPGEPAEPLAVGGVERPIPATVKIRVADRAGTRILTLPLDGYVLGAVRAELMPATLREDPASPMLDVQALVSRTYAVANLGRHAADGFDLCDTTHCQVYRSAAADESATDQAACAVAATRGQIITYQGRAIQALFHANCGGYTASAASVWGGNDAPYLTSVPDWFCNQHPPPEWTFSETMSTLRSVLNTDQRTSVGGRLDTVAVAGRDPSGRALLVALSGSRSVTVRAEAFRSVVNQAYGQRSIRSARFTIVRRGGRLVISGIGYGHGVGLCQAGAAMRARAGQSPAAIITHYFPGARIEPAQTSAR